jgi:hypothetical protein
VRYATTLYARFIGIAVCLYAGWMFLGNLIVAVLGENRYSSTWVLPMVLAAAAVGVAGSAVFLLSFDGSSRWRTRTWRVVGWSGMVLCLLLPTSISFFLLPLVGLAALTLATKPTPREDLEQVATASG